MSDFNQEDVIRQGGIDRVSDMKSLMFSAPLILFSVWGSRLESLHMASIKFITKAANDTWLR